MAKINTSISIDVVAFDELKSYAKNYFNGNVSKCIEWFGFSKKSQEDFCRSMAKHHFREAVKFKEIADELEEQRKEVARCEI